VTVEVNAMEDGLFSIDLATNSPAFYLTLNAEGIGGEFDDNCFLLLPGEERNLVFTAKENPPTAEKMQAAIQVQHLRSTYV